MRHVLGGLQSVRAGVAVFDGKACVRFPVYALALAFLINLASAAALAQAKPDRPWEEDILYFVIVDRFADGDPNNNVKVNPNAKGAFHGGDLVGLTQQLDDLAELGVTALWITPVVKNIDGYVDGAGFPDWGYHGYWADDFNQIDPRFGTEAELKNLVDEAHKRGIKVLLDVVYNHPGYNSSYARREDYEKWVRNGRRGSECGDTPITECLAGLPDFKTENPEVAAYLFDAHMGLAKRTGIDGFRLDTVKHVTNEFWAKHRAEVNQRLGEDFYLLGELWGGDANVLDPYFEQDLMDGGFDFGFKGSAKGFVDGRGRTIAFSRYLMKRHKVRDGYHLFHYLSSHDVPGLLWELKGDKTKFKLITTLQMTSLGVPTIYYGEEVGRMGGDWPENRSHMPWGDRDILPGKGDARDEALRDFYKRLIAARKNLKPLAYGDYVELATDGDVLVFGRQMNEPKEMVVVVVNRGEAAEFSIPWPEMWQVDQVQDWLSDAKVKVSEDGARSLQLKVEPQTAYILAPQ